MSMLETQNTCTRVLIKILVRLQHFIHLMGEDFKSEVSHLKKDLNEPKHSSTGYEENVLLQIKFNRK